MKNKPLHRVNPIPLIKVDKKWIGNVLEKALEIERRKAVSQR